MRITNTMITNRMVTTMNTNLSAVNDYYIKMSSQKKIQMPSDNPIIASRALKYRTTVSETVQYQENSNQARSWLEVTESSFNNINSIYDTMRDLCISAATDSKDDEDRKKDLDSFDSNLEQLEKELNVTHMGRYVFSGYKTDVKPIIEDENGKNILNPEIYGEDLNGSTIKGQNIKIEIGVDTYMGINTFATDVYTEEMYNTLHSLRNYIETGDLGALQKAMGNDTDIKDLRDACDKMIGKIDEFKANVAVEHTKVGVKMNRVDLTKNRLSDDYTNYKNLMSNNEDVNLAMAAMEYNTANAVYNAALRVGMNITQLSLVDYL